MKFKSAFGKEYEVELNVSSYSNNGCMYVGLTTKEDGHIEPFGNATVNISHTPAPDYCGYLDTNNLPTIEKFVRENDLGEPTGVVGFSGYCTYPLYKFNADKLRELCPEDMAIYEENLKGDLEQPEEDNEFVNLADIIDLDI